jgi:hypothetical protein
MSSGGGIGPGPAGRVVRSARCRDPQVLGGPPTAPKSLRKAFLRPRPDLAAFPHHAWSAAAAPDCTPPLGAVVSFSLRPAHALVTAASRPSRTGVQTASPASRPAGATSACPARPALSAGSRMSPLAPVTLPVLSSMIFTRNLPMGRLWTSLLALICSSLPPNQWNSQRVVSPVSFEMKAIRLPSGDQRGLVRSKSP